MESRVKLLGHPIHPMLIPFPIGLLATSLIFDILGLLTGNDELSRVAFWMVAAGIVGGLAAIPFGFLDWLHIPRGTRARTVGLIHGVGNVIVVVLMTISLVLRLDDPSSTPTLALLASIAGVALITATGWLGGELVDRMRVGVDDGAHLNSPISLSGRPAEESATGGRSAGTAV
ncbi:MAG TPA: DUF2231 domain-containing protein [Candidatus Caenarcaniphilales bacterium]|nr:DUF2231 domain-containing protein [Candidatus Caenarcaniphilales bacterium]